MRPSSRTHSILILLAAAVTAACATPARTASTPSSSRRDASLPRPELRLVDASPTSPRLTTVATYKVNRSVSMYYKLDLAKDNRYAQAMASLLRQQEEKFRACYLNRLDQTPQLRGYVAFTFVVTKTVGSMDRIKRVSGTIDDAHLNACLSRELAKVPLNPPKSMRGKLLYQFDVVESVARNQPRNAANRLLNGAPVAP